MSTKSVLNDLIETLADGREGFAKGAEKLSDDGRDDLARTFRELSEQRSRFADELRQVGRQLGEDIDETGSLGGALHRGWMSIKDALSGDDPGGVLDAAEQGEDHAKSEYADALDGDDLPPQVRVVVERQAGEISAAHERVRELRDAHTV